MTKGVGKNVVSIIRRKCPSCGWKQSNKSRSRGKFIVYETKNTWILKCINKSCDGEIVINKHPEDIRDKKNTEIDEYNVLDKLAKLDMRAVTNR